MSLNPSVEEPQTSSSPTGGTTPTSLRDDSGAPLIPAAQALRFLPHRSPFTSWEGNVPLASVLGASEAYRLEEVGLLDNELWAESEPSKDTVEAFAPHRVRIGVEEFRHHFRTRNPHRMKPIGKCSWIHQERDRLIRMEKSIDDLREQPVLFEHPDLAPLIRRKLASVRGRPAIKRPESLHFVNRLIQAPVAVSGTPERLFGCFDLGRGWGVYLLVAEYIGETQQPLEDTGNWSSLIELDCGDLRVVGLLWRKDLLAGVLRDGG